MLQKIATEFHGELFHQFVNGYPIVCGLIALGFLLHFLPESWNRQTGNWMSRLPLWGQIIFFVLTIYLVIQVKSSAVQPFIYLQF